MITTRTWYLKFLVLLFAVFTILFYFLSDVNDNPTVQILFENHGEEPPLMNGEERARRVQERCSQHPEYRTCLYPSRGIVKRLLPVPDKKLAMCVMGKIGSSNWKTLILRLRGVITEEEARNMTYPHRKEYWQNNGTLYFYKRPERLKMIETIERDYYKVTFVRDPLSRMLSAYRDKFTGTSEEHMFKVYRSKRAYDMCKSLEDLILLKPDGDLIPDEIYRYMSTELERHCSNKKEKFVSLGIFFLIFIFMPQDFNGDLLKDLIVNTHFNDMLSLCGHCRIKYDFIGTVETMDRDYEFLRHRLGIEYNLPKIESTQLGVMSKEGVKTMWDNIPHLMKQYIYLFLSNDANAFGYNGYNTKLNKSALPNHYERRTNCDTWY